MRMGGKVVDAPAHGDLDALIGRPVARCQGDLLSRLPKSLGNRPLGDSDVGRPSLNDVDVGVVRAVYGGGRNRIGAGFTEASSRSTRWDFWRSIWSSCSIRQRIVGNLDHAYREREHFDARYGVFMTGPSATADIEGVLIMRCKASGR